jgi:hypothetical protein
VNCSQKKHEKDEQLIGSDLENVQPRSLFRRLASEKGYLTIERNIFRHEPTPSGVKGEYLSYGDQLQSGRSTSHDGMDFTSPGNTLDTGP